MDTSSAISKKIGLFDISYPRAGYMRVCKDKYNDHWRRPPEYSLACDAYVHPWCTFCDESSYPICLKGLPESGVLKKEKKYAGLMAAEPYSGRIVVLPPPMPMVS